MKISFYISVAASGLCLLLSIILLVVGNTNQAAQLEVQKQQQELQKQQEQLNIANQISQTVGPNLLREMAVVSIKNEKMKLLLGKHGYNVQQQAAPANGGGASSAPASSAPAPAAAPAPAPAPAAPSDSVPALR